ncbi:hypothetical protein B0H12DRAFT_1236876 [Mycena haematopus]|nr:hypothetical protein B0H12DRAFT_1236876 [Mycena haematopus]
MSYNSSVIASGLAILEDPRNASSRVIVFTASVYVGSNAVNTGASESAVENLRGSLRYFKDEADTTAYPPVGIYYVVFGAAKMEPGVEVYTEDTAKIVFVGDIKQLCLLEALDPIDPIWSIDPRQRVSVHVCCAVTSSNQQAATFTAAPEQFTFAFADVKKAAEKSQSSFPKSVFPLSATIPDSHRFKGSTKPTPYSNKYCGFTGYLTGMSSELEGSKVIDRFTIEVDTIAFLGNVVSVLPKATPSQAKGAIGTSSGGGK